MGSRGCDGSRAVTDVIVASVGSCTGRLGWGARRIWRGHRWNRRTQFVSRLNTSGVRQGEPAHRGDGCKERPCEGFSTRRVDAECDEDTVSSHWVAPQRLDKIARNRVALFWILGLNDQNTREAANDMKNAVFWDVTPCGSCKNRRFGGTHRLHHQGEKHQRAKNNVSSNKQLKHTAKRD
jgi:hypothetical protein